MARITSSNGSSSRSLHNVMLAMIMAFLASLPLANCADNKTSIWNNLSGAYAPHPVYARCSFHSDSYRYVEPISRLLKSGETRYINVDDFSGVKQVQCSIIRYFSSVATYKSTMKAVVWSSDGPSQTAFQFANGGLYYAVPPNLNSWIGTGLSDVADVEYYYIPSFLPSSVTAIESPGEASM